MAEDPIPPAAPVIRCAHPASSSRVHHRNQRFVMRRTRLVSEVRVLTDMQQVNLTLRALVKPDEGHLATVYRSLGLDYASRVLPSIVNEVVKAVMVRNCLPSHFYFCAGAASGPNNSHDPHLLMCRQNMLQRAC